MTVCNCGREGSAKMVKVKCGACASVLRGHYCADCAAAVRRQSFCTGAYRADGLEEDF